MFGLPDAGKVRAAFAKYEAAKAAIPPAQWDHGMIVAMAQMIDDMHAAFPAQAEAVSVDHRLVKLGKRPTRIDKRTLQMGKYLLSSLPPPPPAVTNSRNVKSWGMMLNGPNDNKDKSLRNGIGNCTCASVAHAHQVAVISQVREGISSDVIMPSDDAVLGIYERWCGFDPADPSTDNGGVELDVLNRWRQDGFEGREILAFVAVDPKNILHVRQSIYLFGGLYVGMAMPDGWQGADVWDAGMGAPNSWGGHAMFMPDYSSHLFRSITWGSLQTITLAGFQEYCDEAYAIVFKDWEIDGFDSESLVADLKAVAS